MNKSEQLIACLEGEIANRDEELAACRVAVENCELFRARIAELEARIVWLECEAQVNAAPVSEAKAQGVVLPERKQYHDYLSLYDKGEAIGHNNALSEVARLNAAPAAPAADAGLVEALETIINPIEAMRRELQVGEQLNGMVAMQLASDPEYLRGVAKAAIAAHCAKGVV